ncbi:hypothetical protein SAMN03159306_01965 [Pseudomonas sp. NFACC48-1]|nr:hypothetical protein SAMN03159424_01877 [Pseudomonas sp. NFACC05-1]SCZ29105.1 hypothetical protein SAMN03159405_02170 [Pseudomonas sp. NFACC44-2]SDA62112.1 hypothetical protein SAMN03159429_02121 [Pseudomonas sp. NFACC51]SDX55219.1 hypothetical protein SAMN03159474_03281 [Pseudomonas sp. NFACC08-1]SEJ18575.1 hypothetical protein SAMN03159298_02396 [Pseudomonas sp. NFACC07-1]SFH89752.1 hypothetical protein SAMN03159302_02886 [Pseudomonas sp. NFACC54]SFL21832.1 hypothetical protein SAMN03159
MPPNSYVFSRGAGLRRADELQALAPFREHGMSQSDLPGVGTQSVVSEVLSGKRQLNLRQIRWLAERFGVAQ